MTMFVVVMAAFDAALRFLSVIPALDTLIITDFCGIAYNSR